MTMGRPPLGPSSVEGLDGAMSEKERLRVILETLAGERSVTDACSDLGLRRSRFHELRVKVLQAGLDALAPGVPGRPRKPTPRDKGCVFELERENIRLRRQLDGARVRAEIALAMPGLVRVFSKPEKGAAKSRDRRRRAAKNGTTRG